MNALWLVSSFESSSLDHRLPRIFVSVRVKEKLVCSWISLLFLFLRVYLLTSFLSLYSQFRRVYEKESAGKRGTHCQRTSVTKTPKEAIEGNYIDKKCPFTGASPSEVESCPASSSLRNEPHHHPPHGLLALYQKVPEIRKETLEHCRAYFPGVSMQGRRQGCRRPVQTVVQDCSFQRLESHPMGPLPGKVSSRTKLCVRCMESGKVDFIIRVISYSRLNNSLL